MTNLATDTTLHQQLDTMEDTQVKPLVLRISDTKRLVAHERYVQALAIYAFVEAGAKMALPVMATFSVAAPALLLVMLADNAPVPVVAV